MDELVKILGNVAVALDGVSTQLSDALETLRSIDAKLGVPSGMWGLDDIHSQLTDIGSSLQSIEFHTSGIEINTSG